MKIIASLWMATFITFSATAQDTIANPGFENWTNHGTYEAPDDWTTLNPLTFVVGITTAIKTTAAAEVRSGTYAIKLQTKSLAGNPEPGLITTGFVNTSAQTIDGGIPISSRPLALRGWYQYAPVGSDAASFDIFLYKRDTTSGTREQIGSGSLTASSAVSTWTEFTVPVIYTSSDVPDTVKIVIYSSGFAPEVNSTLLLDDLSYDFGTGIRDETPSLNIFPNPASHKIVFENSLNAERVEVYTVQGKMLRHYPITPGMNTLDVSALEPGIYLFIVLRADGAILKETITIQR